MLQDFLQKLCGELAISPVPKLNEKKFYSFRISEEIEAQLRDLDPGVSMTARIASCPSARREDLFIFLMRANLLGQGTGGARIGMEGGDKFLTLSLGLPYEMNYQTFRETLEDFINYLIYWREEVAKFEKEQQTVL
jgi:hypothetical protein